MTRQWIGGLSKSQDQNSVGSFSIVLLILLVAIDDHEKPALFKTRKCIDPNLFRVMAAMMFSVTEGKCNASNVRLTDFRIFRLPRAHG